MINRFSVPLLSDCTQQLTNVASGKIIPDLVLSNARILSTYTDRILEDKEIKPENNVIVLINGMGGTTLMELYSVFNEVSIYLKNKKKFFYHEITYSL